MTQVPRQQHHPGWYPDPHVPNQLRWWDGERWTARIQPGVGQAPEPGRPNPFAFAVPSGVLAAIALAAIEMPRSSETAAYVAGQAIAWALMASVVAGGIGYATKSSMPWWLYPPVTLAVAFALYGLVRMGEWQEDQSRAAERAELVAPQAFGALQGADAEDLEASRQALLERLNEGVDGIESIVVGEYGRPGKQPTVSFFGINAEPGSDMDDDDPDDAVRDYFAGAGVDDPESVDPGTLDGAMACTGPDLNGVEGYACVWSDVGVLGVLTFLDGAENVDEAAERTREFRGLAEKDR